MEQQPLALDADHTGGRAVKPAQLGAGVVEHDDLPVMHAQHAVLYWEELQGGQGRLASLTAAGEQIPGPAPGSVQRVPLEKSGSGLKVGVSDVTVQAAHRTRGLIEDEGLWRKAHGHAAR